MTDSETIKSLYETMPYLEAYRTHTDMRVAEDAHEAVGGLWEDIGKLQFEFLKNEGLQPKHTLLDWGCGTLRGGRLFIEFLDGGKYTGVDISEGAIAAALSLIDAQGLRGKAPRLSCNKNPNENCFGVLGTKFDFIFAQSVFTHLPADYISKCFSQVGNILVPSSKFYFTFFDGDEKADHLKGFEYPLSFFVELALANGMRVTPRDYSHPRGQRMAVAELPPRPAPMV